VILQNEQIVSRKLPCLMYYVRRICAMSNMNRTEVAWQPRVHTISIARRRCTYWYVGGRRAIAVVHVLPVCSDAEANSTSIRTHRTKSVK
jgi:hypothetical protein